MVESIDDSISGFDSDHFSLFLNDKDLKLSDVSFFAVMCLSFYLLSSIHAGFVLRWTYNATHTTSASLLGQHGLAS